MPPPSPQPGPPPRVGVMFRQPSPADGRHGTRSGGGEPTESIPPVRGRIGAEPGGHTHRPPAFPGWGPPSPSDVRAVPRHPRPRQIGRERPPGAGNGIPDRPRPPGMSSRDEPQTSRRRISPETPGAGEESYVKTMMKPDCRPQGGKAWTLKGPCPARAGGPRLTRSFRKGRSSGLSCGRPSRSGMLRPESDGKTLCV
jgi:hypothetical protein